jgi:hypothetical protein
MIAWIFRLSAVLVLLTSGANAATREERALFDSFEGRVRVGREIEISEFDLARFIRNYDLDAYNASENGKPMQAAPQKYVDGYLDSWNAVMSLPIPLREQLTQGLNHLQEFKLEVAKAEPPKNLAAQKSPEAPQGLILPKSSQLITGPKISAPKSLVPEPQAVVDSPAFALARSQYDWGVLNQRWKALPESEKRGAMRLSRMPAQWLGKFFVEHRFEMGKLAPKLDLPQGVRDVLSSMEPQGMNSYVEFRNPINRPETDLAKYIDQTEAFAEIAGVHGELWAVGKPGAAELKAERGQFPTSYHIHLSVEGEDLTEIARGMSIQRVFQAMASGFHPLTDRKFVTFKSVSDKGLVRLVSPDRVEIRFHTENPRAELARTLNYIKDPKLLYKDLKSEITPARIESLIPDFLESGHAAEFIADLRKVSSNCVDCHLLSPESIRVLEKHLASKNMEEQLGVISLAEALAGRETLPPEFLAKFEERVQDYVLRAEGLGPEGEIRRLARIFERFNSATFEKTWESLLSHSNERVIITALSALNLTEKPEVLDKIVALLEHADGHIRHLAFSILSDKPLSPKLKNQLINLVETGWVNWVKIKAARLLLPTTQDPAVLRKIVGLLNTSPEANFSELEQAILESKNPEMTRFLFSSIPNFTASGKTRIFKILADLRPLSEARQRALIAYLPRLSESEGTSMLYAFSGYKLDPLVVQKLTELEIASPKNGDFGSHLRVLLSQQRKLGLPTEVRGCLNGALVTIRKLAQP